MKNIDISFFSEKWKYLNCEKHSVGTWFYLLYFLTILDVFIFSHVLRWKHPINGCKYLYGYYHRYKLFQKINFSCRPKILKLEKSSRFQIFIEFTAYVKVWFEPIKFQKKIITLCRAANSKWRNLPNQFLWKKSTLMFTFILNFLGSNHAFHWDKHPVKISSQTDKRFLKIFGRRAKIIILRKPRLKL